MTTNAKTNQKQTPPISSFQNGLANIEYVWQYVTLTMCQEILILGAQQLWCESGDGSHAVVADIQGKKKTVPKNGGQKVQPEHKKHTYTHTHTRACHRECINCITKAMFHIFVPRDAHGTRRVWWSMLQGTIRDHGLLDDSRWSINVVWQSPWHRIPYLGKGLGKNHQDQWALKIIKGIYCLNGRPRDSINDACRNAKCWKHARTVCLTWTAYS